jgi:hypothetical protein
VRIHAQVRLAVERSASMEPMAENNGGTGEPRMLRLRYADTCKSCEAAVPKGTQAWWSSQDKTIECLTCHNGQDAGEPAVGPRSDEAPVEVAASGADPSPDSGGKAARPSGVAGASAQREYDRRAARERARQEAALERDAQKRAARREARPVLGRLVNAFVERPPEPSESQPTQAWKVGAAGERRVAEILDATSCFVLHDRRIPNSKTNIDHLAVGPAGVFVIDAKKYEDKRLEIRDKGTFFRPDPRLYVGGRDQTKLVTGVMRQVEVVHEVLADSDVPVHAVLCFVGARWPGLFSNKPLRVSGVTATYPVALGKLVTQEGALTADLIRHVGERLAERLPRA